MAFKAAMNMSDTVLSASNGSPSKASCIATLVPRSSAWVVSCLFAIRLGAPLLALSGDLCSAEEVQRNREALAEHRPSIVILDGSLRDSAAAGPLDEQGTWPTVEVATLLSAIGVHKPLPQLQSRSADDVLYFVYTGGTTSASKCAAVTHRMALHELEVYPKISPLECTDRVLHQTSAFWGATSMGWSSRGYTRD